MKDFFVYILTDDHHDHFYVGMTSNVGRRMYEHQEGLISGYTKDHGIWKVVFLEHHETAESAIRREKLLKKWRRQWKIDLIAKHNPDWHDLYGSLNF